MRYARMALAVVFALLACVLVLDDHWVFGTLFVLFTCASLEGA